MVEVLFLIQKEVELQKIQVLDNNFQSKLNLEFSVVVAFFAGFLILFATIYYQDIIDIFTYTIGSTIITAVTIISINFLRKQRLKHFSFISKLIHQIENYESLPSLEILNQTKK